MKIKNLFIAGGTSGMGKAIAMHYLRRGSTVTVVGSTDSKGKRLLEEAAQFGVAEHLNYIQANLMSVAENRRVIEIVKARHESLDAVILTAMMPFPKRIETEDGFEGTFSLYYVSRFVLSYGLTDLLERSENPLILSLGGTGMTQGKIHWDDLALNSRYNLFTAMLQGGRANDLLGVAYAENHKNGKTRFILDHPGYTNSGLGHVKQPMRTLMRIMAILFAQPVEKSIQLIIQLLDNPPQQPLIAWDRTHAVDLSLTSLDPANAQRLYEATKHLVADFVADPIK